MGHLSIFHIDAKRILNTFQIRREKTHRQQDSLKTKLNLHSRACNLILDLRMKWVLLPYSELYSEEKTICIRKCTLRVITSFSVIFIYANIPA